MTELEIICEQALYRELQTLADGRSLVMDMSSDQIYYKKILSVYSIPVFSWLKDHPHPNIPYVSAFWQQDGKLVVIEEQINGKTLEQLLDEGDLPFAEKKRILLAVCDGLMFLHSAKPPIIHRDLKASNIMVAGDGAVKLIDYDAAKIFDKDAKRDTVLIGTQGIAAPEQYGFGASDERTDIFALGKLVERLLPDDAAAAVIVDKATRMEPTDRYANVALVRAKIARLKEGGSGKNASGSGGTGPRKKTWVLIGAAVLAAVLIFLLAGLRGCGEAEMTDPFKTQSETAGEAGTSAESVTEEIAETTAKTGEGGQTENSPENTTAPAPESQTESTSQLSTEDQAAVETGSAAESRQEDITQSAAEGQTEPSEDPSQDTTAQSAEQPWQAALTLEEGEPLGDMKVMKITAALSGGPEGGVTHIRFEIDVTATGEHLSYTTEDTYGAGQSASAMFSAQAGRPESGQPSGYRIFAYDDDGNVLGEFTGKAGE